MTTSQNAYEATNKNTVIFFHFFTGVGAMMGLKNCGVKNRTFSMVQWSTSNAERSFSAEFHLFNPDSLAHTRTQ